MFKFKTLFDLEQQNSCTVEMVEEFKSWQKNQDYNRVFVNNLALFDAWIDAINKGEKWYHFNLDWEDKYIKLHEKTLIKK